MILSDIGASELRERLRAGSLLLNIGEFTVSLASTIPSVSENLGLLYADYALSEEGALPDFIVELNSPGLLRRYVRPQVGFSLDGLSPFKPLPRAQAFAMFEWGLNWCVANSAHHHLLIHAAVVERNGRALIFPGSPGSGKSTLSATLSLSGWRLLSDEMTMLSLDDSQAVPFPRPVSLKNESIEFVRNFSSQAKLGEVVRDTAKGTVGHMRPLRDSVRRSTERATPAAFIFPKFELGAKTELVPMDRGYAYMELASHSFNYNVLGPEGFEFLARIIDDCDCYSFRYHNTDEALAVMNSLVTESACV